MLSFIEMKFLIEGFQGNIFDLGTEFFSEYLYAARVHHCVDIKKLNKKKLSSARERHRGIFHDK